MVHDAGNMLQHINSTVKDPFNKEPMSTWRIIQLMVTLPIRGPSWAETTTIYASAPGSQPCWQPILQSLQRSHASGLAPALSG